MSLQLWEFLICPSQHYEIKQKYLSSCLNIKACKPNSNWHVWLFWNGGKNFPTRPPVLPQLCEACSFLCLLSLILASINQTKPKTWERCRSSDICSVAATFRLNQTVWSTVAHCQHLQPFCTNYAEYFNLILNVLQGVQEDAFHSWLEVIILFT